MVAALLAPEGDFRPWTVAEEWGASIGAALPADRTTGDLAADAGTSGGRQA